MNILVVGSLNVDYNVTTSNLPKHGETVSAHDFFIVPGGKGLNQAVAASRLGATVSMIGKVGSDQNGDMLIDVLRRESIPIEGISRSNTPTGNAFITVDSKGMNTIIVYPGANYDLSIVDIDENIDLLKNANLILMQLEIPMQVVEYVTTKAKSMNIPVVLNPAPSQHLSNELLTSIDFLTPNETEVKELTGIEDLENAAKSLLSKGVKNVVITLGKEGSMYLGEYGNIKVPGYEVDAIDTTAAGDSFNGAMSLKYLEGSTPEEFLRFSNKVGALTTTTKGAVNSLPFIDDLDKFI